MGRENKVRTVGSSRRQGGKEGVGRGLVCERQMERVPEQGAALGRGAGKDPQFLCPQPDAASPPHLPAALLGDYPLGSLVALPICLPPPCSRPPMPSKGQRSLQG